MEQDLLPLLMQNKLLQGLTDDQVRRAMDLAGYSAYVVCGGWNTGQRDRGRSE